MAQSKLMNSEYYYAQQIGWLEINQNEQGSIHSIQHLYDEPNSQNISAEIQLIMEQFFLQKISPDFSSFALQGTAFQKRVWKALYDIPWGKTQTYGELAKLLKTSPRAIGNACRSNPIVALIPCHRVLSKTGIGGYSGSVTGKKIDRKLALLQYEQKQ